MRNVKKLLALLLALIMVISLLPAVSIAEEPRETYGDDYSEWQSWWNGSTETFYGKNKAKDKEGILKKITLGLFVFIIICAIICFVVGIRA